MVRRIANRRCVIFWKLYHSGIKFTSDITIFLYYYILIRNTWEAVWIVIREKSGMLAPFLISFARDYWQERVLLGTIFFKKLNNLHLQRGAFSEYSIIVNFFLHKSRCRLGVPCMSPDDASGEDLTILLIFWYIPRSTWIIKSCHYWILLIRKWIFMVWYLKIGS